MQYKYIEKTFYFQEFLMALIKCGSTKKCFEYAQFTHLMRFVELYMEYFISHLATEQKINTF